MLTSDTVEQLSASLDRMLPAGVMYAANPVTDQEETFEYPEEEKQVVKAVTKRRNEFVVGRRCARAALAQMGVASCALLPDADRIPRWPSGTVGSISHSVGLCCAVTASVDVVACLGVDLETTTRISSGVIERILHPGEVDFVNGNKVFGSLIFSAKEAFFKAQFPIWKAWPNFNDLAFRVDVSNGRLQVVEVADHLPSDLQTAAGNMQFRYAFLDNYVLTLCWLDKALS